MNNQKENNEIIIIGGGPAGMTAAIQLTRYGLSPLLLERRELGGLLWNANLVENYPGFPNGVRGEKLIRLMTKQMERIGVEVAFGEVTSVDWEGERFRVVTQDATRVAQYLVVASGTRSRQLPNVISPEAQARVFTEIRPLKEVQEKRIIIVGAGDAAFDYALNLSKDRNFVTILNRGDSVKCLGLLYERAAQVSNIRYLANKPVTEIRSVASQRSKVAGLSTLRHGSGQASDLRLEIVCPSELFEADYVIFAIGRDPNLDFLSENVRQRERELVESGRLYFVGDVKNELYRQVAIAAGDGLRAAMQIYSRMAK